MQEHVQRGQHQRDRAEQLDQYVQRWASSILEGITNGIADYTRLVRLALLPEDDALGIKAVNHLTSGIHAQVTSLNVLLRIVPCTTTVVQEQGEDDTTHSTDHQHTGLGLWAKDDADGDRREHGNNAG